jgi:hypothetical protein
MEGLAVERGKVGLVVVKRRAGKGTPTPRVVVMTEKTFEALRSVWSEVKNEGMAL